MNYRICKFNLTHLANGDPVIIERHPQAAADSTTGTIVVRLESWIGHDAQVKIVEAMNAAQIDAGELGGMEPESEDEDQ